MPNRILEIKTAQNGFVVTPYSDYNEYSQMEAEPANVFMAADDLSDFVRSWAVDTSGANDAMDAFDYDEVYDVPDAGLPSVPPVI